MHNPQPQNHPAASLHRQAAGFAERLEMGKPQEPGQRIAILARGELLKLADQVREVHQALDTVWVGRCALERRRLRSQTHTHTFPCHAQWLYADNTARILRLQY